MDASIACTCKWEFYDVWNTGMVVDRECPVHGEEAIKRKEEIRQRRN